MPDTSIADTQESDQNTYTVVEGDTLWSISEKYYGTGFDWEKIKTANNLTDANDIEKGQKLVIPKLEDSNAAVAEATASSEPTQEPIVESTPSATSEVVVAATPESVITQTNTQVNTSTSHPATYTVVHGDNLWNIAVAMYGDGYRWVDIAHANKLVHPGIIHAGNVLVLPN